MNEGDDIPFEVAKSLLPEIHRLLGDTVEEILVVRRQDDCSILSSSDEVIFEP